MKNKSVKPQQKKDPRGKRIAPKKVMREKEIPEFCHLSDRPRHPSCDIAIIGTAEEIEIARAILNDS